MDKPVKHAVLPQSYRKPQPKPLPTIGSLEVGDDAYVRKEDLAVDHAWGVWIAPNTCTSPHRTNDKPVLVTLTRQGLIVCLANIPSAKEAFVNNEESSESLEEAGYIRVFEVN